MVDSYINIFLHFHKIQVVALLKYYFKGVIFQALRPAKFFLGIHI